MSRSPIGKPPLREWHTPQGSPVTSHYYLSLQNEVVRWWREHQRQDLPWRPVLSASTEVHAEERIPSSGSSDAILCQPTPRYDPYEVWVAEVMSQQTRMETVIPYYTKWMRRFPTIVSLAAASEDEVKAVWAGMGYYRRALYLQRGAKYLMDWQRQRCDSSLSMPDTYEELLKIPSVGPYTAAAIASMCFGRPVCSVDGNVIRVLSRLRGERNFDPKVTKNIKIATSWGQELMGNSSHAHSVVCADPSALNQGLMELGASVCRPAGSPLCAVCPVREYCSACSLLQCGEIESIEGVIPMRAAVPKKRQESVMTVVHELLRVGNGRPGLSDGRCFVVVRRPPDGLLGGMLEFPTLAIPTGEDVELLTPLVCSDDRIGLTPSSINFIDTVRHVFTHITMDVKVMHVRWPHTIPEAVLVKKIATVLNEHSRIDDGQTSALERTCFMNEAILRQSAPSSLMLKVLKEIPSDSDFSIDAGSTRNKKGPHLPKKRPRKERTLTL